MTMSTAVVTNATVDGDGGDESNSHRGDDATARRGVDSE